jgi:hypothetical protein
MDKSSRTLKWICSKKIYLLSRVSQFNSDFNELVSNNLLEAKGKEEQSFSEIAKNYLLPKIRPFALRVRMDQRKFQRRNKFVGGH